MSEPEEILTQEQQEEIERWAQTLTALNTINECIVKLTERVNAIEKYIQEMPTPDKTYYKPHGEEEYLNVKANYDLIYNRLRALEDGMQN